MPRSLRSSVPVNGLATRLSGFSAGVLDRLALGCAIAALVSAAVAGFLFVWAFPLLSSTGLVWIVPTLSVGLCPSLIVVGGASVARRTGRLADSTVIAVVILALSALAIATLGSISYGQAFSAADDDRPYSLFAEAWPWLVVTAYLLGATAMSLLLAALFRTSPRRFATAALSCTIAITVVPVLGVTLNSPFTSVFGAIGLTLVALIRPSRPASDGEDQPHASRLRGGADADIPHHTRTIARLLAVATAVLSTGGVVHALAGVHWSPTLDGTETMRQGITVSLLSALPLLAAVGLLCGVGRSRIIHLWGQLLLVTLALVAVSVGYRGAPSWDQMAAFFAVGSGLEGAALSWWLIPRLPGSRRGRVWVAICVGIAYAATVGILVTPMLAFALPLLAVAFAIWAPRHARREPRPQPTFRATAR